MVAHRDPGAKGWADNARIAYQSKILVSVNEMLLEKALCNPAAKLADQYRAACETQGLLQNRSCAESVLRTGILPRS
jgi:hypothetical protein